MKLQRLTAALSGVSCAALLLCACENRPAHPLAEKTEAPVTGITVLTSLTAQTTLTAFSTTSSAPGTTDAETRTAVPETTKPPRETVLPENLPAGLNTFLAGLARYSADYNADRLEHQEEFLLALLRGGLCDFSQYPGETYPSDGFKDPRQRWNEETREQSKAFCAEKVNWILRNIFCWSEMDISKLAGLGEEGAWRPNYEQSFYLDNGVYYAFTGEPAGGYVTALDSVTTDGMYYYVTYRVQTGTVSEEAGMPAETTVTSVTSGTTAEPIYGELVEAGMFQAIVVNKQIDGQSYWALLKKSDKPLF